MKIINRRNIVSGEVFHVLNRGVDKKNIFLDDKDYFRFVHNLFEFNDTNPALNSGIFGVEPNLSIYEINMLKGSREN